MFLVIEVPLVYPTVIVDIVTGSGIYKYCWDDCFLKQLIASVSKTLTYKVNALVGISTEKFLFSFGYINPLD
jgi:hypothetical protein